MAAVLYSPSLQFHADCGLCSSLLCWGHTLYCTGRLIRLGIFFSSLQSPYSTSPGRDVNVISFHMALQRANVTAESGARTALPQPPLQSASVALDGPLKCVIHPCPLSGVSTQKTGLPRDTTLQWTHLFQDVCKVFESTPCSRYFKPALGCHVWVIFIYFYFV